MRSQCEEYLTARLPWLRRVAFLLCQDWHRADDLVQSAVMRIFLNWSRVESAQSPDAYARTILINTFLAEQRSPWWRRVALPHPRSGAEGGVQDPDEFLAGLAAPSGPDREELLDLRRALLDLPPRQRAVVVLRYYCELSVEESSEVLSCAPGTIKSQTFRAIESLRRSLALAPEPDSPPRSAGSPADPSPRRTPSETELGRSTTWAPISTTN